jgi:hypothetical protein
MAANRMPGVGDAAQANLIRSSLTSRLLLDIPGREAAYARVISRKEGLLPKPPPGARAHLVQTQPTLRLDNLHKRPSAPGKGC